MKKLNVLFSKIPALISSKVSILLYIFLFFYLVIYALICAIVPALHDFQPSDTTQLIMGNYTNVLSALGASIAAGTGAAAHKQSKKLRVQHEELQKTIEDLQSALDKLKSMEQSTQEP